MSTPAAVTVIVPGHNVAPYAAEALESLRRQTLQEWTAVLIDDHSTDATADVFAQAADADPRFRLVRNDRQLGLGAARNIGLDLVRTPFLGFLDADDCSRRRRCSCSSAARRDGKRLRGGRIRAPATRR